MRKLWETLTSRNPLWIPSRIPLEFPPTPFGIHLASISIPCTRLGLDASGLSKAIILWTRCAKTMRKLWIPKSLSGFLQNPFGISPDSLWNSPRISIRTVHKQNLRWTPQAFPTQAYYELTMRKLWETMTSRIPFWIPSGIPSEFPPNLFGTHLAALSILCTRFGLDASGFSNASILWTYYAKTIRILCIPEFLFGLPLGHLWNSFRIPLGLISHPYP